MAQDVPSDDLIDALVERRCVLWLGSGLSVSSGFPTWRQLLGNLLKDVKQHAHVRDKQLEEIEHAFHRGHLVDTAEGLAQVIVSAEHGFTRERAPRSLGDYIRAAFEHPPTSEWPAGTLHKFNSTHLALTRLPFSVVITPNYDDLLEKAYDKTYSKPEGEKAVWSVVVKDDFDGTQIIQADGRLTIFKSHGEIDDPSTLLLTATHYRRATHGRQSFRDYLKSLLMTRTFLFVGTRLEDPDLVNVLDELALSHGWIRNHFAIMPSPEVGPLRVERLFKHYGINVITYKCKVIEDPPTYKTASIQANAVRKALQEIAGAVAKRSIESVDAGLFSRQRLLEELVVKARVRTGSFRVDLCLTESPGVSSDIEKVAWDGPTDDTGTEVNVQSVIGKTFYQAPLDGILVEDVLELQRHKPGGPASTSQKWLSDLLSQYGEFEYKECHRDVRSELSVPIVASGNRVGVLNFESDLPDAYTPLHREVARRLAQQIGNVVATSAQRHAATRFFRELSSEHLTDFFRAHRYLSNRIVGDGEPKLVHEVLPADYIKGHLTSRLGKPFAFNASAFLLRVFKVEEPMLLTHAPNGVKHGLAESWCQQDFKIKGSLLGVPIFREGVVAGVLACWPELTEEPADGFHREDAPDTTTAVEGPSYFTSKIRGALNRTTNLVVAIADQGDEGRQHALSYLRAIKESRSIADLLHAFMCYQRDAARIILYTIHGEEDFEDKQAFPRVAYARQRQDDIAVPETIPAVKFNSKDAYFRFTYWRAYTRYYAEPIPIRFFESSRPSAIGRQSDEIWITAPLVTIKSKVDEEYRDGGRVEVQVVRPEVRKVLGFLEVKMLHELDASQSAERNRRDRVCCALNVLTNVMPEFMLST